MDVAVIEVGLGGRLDCTNIIRPDVCIITNISFDHTQFLGDTLAKIAGEKAGIIKSGIPVVIGETTPETKSVFLEKAQATGAPIYFAEENDREDYPGNRIRTERLYQQKKCPDRTHRPPATERSRLPAGRTSSAQWLCPCGGTDGLDGTLAKTAGLAHPDL